MQIGHVLLNPPVMPMTLVMQDVTAVLVAKHVQCQDHSAVVVQCTVYAPRLAWTDHTCLQMCAGGYCNDWGADTERPGAPHWWP